MLITTLLVTLVMLIVWRWHPAPVLAIATSLLAMEGVYLSAVLYQARRPSQRLCMSSLSALTSRHASLSLALLHAP